MITSAFKNLLFTLAGAVFFVACHTTSKVSGEDGTLVNKYWKLVTLNGVPIKMSEHQEKETHFILHAQGTVTGHTGCNGIGGKYGMSGGNKIQFYDMISTLRYCDEVPYESEFNQMLHQANHYVIRNDSLWLSNDGHDPKALFVAVYLK